MRINQSPTSTRHAAFCECKACREYGDWPPAIPEKIAGVLGPYTEQDYEDMTRDELSRQIAWNERQERAYQFERACELVSKAEGEE